MDVDVEINEGPSTTVGVLASTSGEFIASEIQDDLEIASPALKSPSVARIFTNVSTKTITKEIPELNLITISGGSAQETKCAKALTYMFAKDGVADSVLERAGFQYYSGVLCP